jgi:thiol-disulfide isomerase/thioredoxin
MKKYFLILTSTFFSVILFSCDDNLVKDATNIVGNFENGAGKTVTLYQLTPTEVLPIDSVKIDEKGKFNLAKKIDETGYYRVGLSPNDYLVLILKNENEIVELEADANQLAKTYKVKGSEESIIFEEFNKKIMKNYAASDSLQQVYQANMQNPNIQAIGMQLQTEYDALMKDMKEWVKSYIDNNEGSFATLAAIEQLDPDQDFEYFLKVNEALTEKFPTSVFVTNLNSKVENLSKLAINSVAPEINLANPVGELVPLSSLKGKVVLIDFWASWCRPCRMENPNVVRVYNKFKSKGFEIYGVSLDRGKDEWIQAIKDDNLTWIHVSDLMFWNSAAARQYNVTGIPFTVLLDAEGRIIAKNLRGEELEKKLAEILG